LFSDCLDSITKTTTTTTTTTSEPADDDSCSINITLTISLSVAAGFICGEAIVILQFFFKGRCCGIRVIHNFFKNSKKYLPEKSH